jgi:hypothetical protein
VLTALTPVSNTVLHRSTSLALHYAVLQLNPLHSPPSTRHILQYVTHTHTHTHTTHTQHTHTHIHTHTKLPYLFCCSLVVYSDDFTTGPCYTVPVSPPVCWLRRSALATPRSFSLLLVRGSTKHTTALMSGSFRVTTLISVVAVC